jgi:hypothetical protein
MGGILAKILGLTVGQIGSAVTPSGIGAGISGILTWLGNASGNNKRLSTFILLGVVLLVDLLGINPEHMRMIGEFFLSVYAENPGTAP